MSRIIRRTAPDDLRAPLALARPKVKPVGTFALSGLLACPCGATLTGRRGRNKDGSPYVEYYCPRAYKVPGHGKVVVREHIIRPAIEQEAARMGAPEVVERTVSADQRAREAARQRRERIIEAFLDGVLSKVERDTQLARIDADLARLEPSVLAESLPDAIDWDNDPPDAINAVLRALWRSVQLDENLRPVDADWRVPQWRAG